MSNFDSALQQAKQLANSPEGKQLALLLQQLGGSDLQKILNQAAAGDLSQARQTISALIENPEARKLLEKLGGTNGKP